MTLGCPEFGGAGTDRSVRYLLYEWFMIIIFGLARSCLIILLQCTYVPARSSVRGEYHKDEVHRRWFLGYSGSY